MSRFEKMLDNFLEHDAKEVRLKWVFDHIRNYALAVSVVVVGLYLARHGAFAGIFPGLGLLGGAVIVLTGFLLFILNLLQLIFILLKKNMSLPLFMILGLSAFYVASELFWVAVRQAIV